MDPANRFQRHITKHLGTVFARHLDRRDRKLSDQKRRPAHDRWRAWHQLQFDHTRRHRRDKRLDCDHGSSINGHRPRTRTHHMGFGWLGLRLSGLYYPLTTDRCKAAGRSDLLNSRHTKRSKGNSLHPPVPSDTMEGLTPLLITLRFADQLQTADVITPRLISRNGLRHESLRFHLRSARSYVAYTLP